MSRMIDADALIIDIKECIEVKDSNYELEQVEGLNVALECVDDAPTIGSERKKGELKFIAFLTCECSECKAQFHELEYDNFCPNCGVEILKGE